jgi:hypothetical protein
LEQNEIIYTSITENQNNLVYFRHLKDAIYYQLTTNSSDHEVHSLHHLRILQVLVRQASKTDKYKKKRKKKCNLASKSAFEPFNILFYYAFSASILQIQLLSNFFKKEFGGGA